MILADTNFWLALALSRHQFHEIADDWFSQQQQGSVVFCRSTQQSFLRLVSTPALARLYGIPPITNAEGWNLYEKFLADRRCGFASEPASLEGKWSSYTRIKSASPKLWMDAYLAAFAVSAGYQLITIDEGFRQFEGLKAIVLNADE